ncbi:hypothetical protein RBG61_11495 [Paludicola sp. MB14-C6]|uniref:PP2C family protein-serine/threonine phosphatase n=1 Tax=Paludihabitans sp. MB14-C6 TaxID=3070656 RepID=UPI0027DEA20D|nr:hypothetical protein [Paludicola sp. MB14-C6]WMJ22606.1 hypothetical protein RBG61_11495 [Paludicola sp. MB14-C6]
MDIDFYGNTCVGSSNVNGDVFYISSDHKVYLLADGASGAGNDGKVLMGKICIEIIENFEYDSTKLNAKEYIDQLFWKINNRLIETSQYFKKLVFGTLNLAVVDDDILTITTLGDSPAFYYNGVEINRVAKNKKQYEWMIDAGYITKQQYEGYISQMHEMMQCCFDYYVPQIVPNNVIEQYPIKPNNILVLCSDGLSDYISSNDIIRSIQTKGLKDGIDDLILKAKDIALGKQNYFDDITVVAIKIV